MRTGEVVSEWEAGRFGRPDIDLIDLWLVELDRNLPNCVGRDGAEREQARARSARRELLELLGCATDRRPDTIELVSGCRGKPRLRASGAPPVFFNVSRSGPLALFAISQSAELGVDLERRPLHDPWALAAVIEQQMPMERRAGAAETCDCDVVDDPLPLWTRHEAVVKALGLGLSVRFRSMIGLHRSAGSLQFQGCIWAWRDLDLPEHAAAHAALAYRVLAGDERCG